jgi:hypothetical protein
VTQPVERRAVVAGAMKILVAAAMAPLAWMGSAHAREKHGSSTAMKGNAMNVVCQIRYQLDPYKRAQFEEYSKVWLKVIPECGGDLIGYFMPHEGTNDVAFAMIGFDSLAAYETYRAKLKTVPESVANFNFAEREKFILREERVFLMPVKA